jgi:hypothetical protein
MTGWGPFHRKSPQRFTLDQLGYVFLTTCSLVLPVVAASVDWCVSLVDWASCGSFNEQQILTLTLLAHMPL